jgi:group I intron endonuclease
MLCKNKCEFKAGVYAITNIINKKQYVGSSVNVYNRYHTHKNKLLNKTHSSSYLKNAYHKYGEENFIFEVLEYCENITEREQYYINKLKPKYNIRQIAQNNKGLIVSQNTKNKISATLKLKNQKLKEQNLPTLNPKNKDKEISVDIFDLNGNYLTTCISIKEATRYLNSPSSDKHISRICKLKKGTHHNYQFRYSKEKYTKLESTKKSQIMKHFFKKENILLEFSSLVEAGLYFGLKGNCFRNLKRGFYKEYKYYRSPV